jgi:hypothetical protein
VGIADTGSARGRTPSSRSLGEGGQPSRWGRVALLVSITCAGCGGGGSAGTNSGTNNGVGSSSTPFLGVWSCSGNQIETCGTNTHVDTSDFTMTVTQGASPDAIVTGISNNVDVTTGTTSAPGSFDWTVSGNAASLSSPLTLPTVPGSVGGSWTPTYGGASLSFSGPALLWNASGSAVYVNGVTQTCGFTQSYTCSAPATPGGDAGGGETSTGPQLDPTLVGTWAYSLGFFYPDPAGTPGLDVANPPATLTLAADGTYSASASSTPMASSGTWFVGATSPADWVQWRQQYNYPEKLTLDGSTTVTWDGYVDDGDPSGETAGPPQCLDLFYTQAQPQAGYYYFVFCLAAMTKM